MTRRHLTFACHGERLAGTLDEASADTGLLIVSGGNEVRAGPWGSQAMLAARIAESGFPVFRFDRRGIGDSSGQNGGFLGSEDDIAAALAAFRSEAHQLQRIVAFGNCDAASALMLSGGIGLYGLILANPWTFEPDALASTDDRERPAMTASRTRAHYLRRLVDPVAWRRMLGGQVNLREVAASLGVAARRDRGPSELLAAMRTGLARFPGKAAILIADRDRTGQTFLDRWDKTDPRLRRCPEASHSFVEPTARAWLEDRILEILRA